MKHKTLRTLLCVILTVCFCLSAIVPASAAGLFGGDSGAATGWDQLIRGLKDRFIEKNPGTDETPAEPMEGTGDEFIRIFHLDCGRIYFSVDEIKGIIDMLALNNYTHLELAFGNGGLRFLLDDMKLTVNGTSYKSETVKQAIMDGNAAFAQNDGHGGSSAPNTCLTEANMNEILNYAGSKGIGIIPLLNSPGHMNAVVSAIGALRGESAGYPVNGVASNSTINIDDTNVVAASKAIIQKYVDYFRGKCSYFNLGADEFANDPSDHPQLGFNDNMKAGFIGYVNAVAEIISRANMTPMMFNDGYAWNDAEFNKDIVVCYWTRGSVSSTAIANKGHKIINTSQKWYYVLGSPFGTGVDQWCSYASAENGARTVPVTQMIDYGSPDNKLVGSMMCLWCDFTNKTYTTEEVNNVRTLLTTLAENNSTQFGAIKEQRTITLTINETKDVSIATTEALETELLSETIATVSAQQTPITKYNASAISSLSNGEQYLIENNRSKQLLTATMTQTQADTNGLKTEGTVSGESDELWTLGYFYGNSSNYGYTLSRVINGKPQYLVVGKDTAEISETKTAVKIQTTDGYHRIYSYYTDLYNYNYYRYSYLNDYGNNKGVAAGWNDDNNNGVNDAGSKWNLYKLVEDSVQMGTKLTFTGVSVGTTYVSIGDIFYTIHVTEENLVDAPVLTYYPFISDFAVYETSQPSYPDEGEGNPQTISATDANVHSEAGAQLSEIAWAKGYWKWMSAAVETVFWKGMLHIDEKDKQVGVKFDKSMNGTEFKSVRYWNGEWAVSADGVKWTVVEEGYELCAYYLQKTQVTDEVTTYVKDWAYTTADYNNYGNDGRHYKALSFAAVYPNGQLSPSENSIYDESTLVYWYDTGTSESNPTLFIRVGVNEVYEVEKITWTKGSIAADGASGGTMNWDKVTTDGVEWYNESVCWDETYGTEPVVKTSEFFGPGKEYTYSTHKDAVLILIYLKPVVTESSLKVLYWDDSADTHIYDFAINIANTGDEKGTFLDRLIQTSPKQLGEITLDDGAYVINTKNVNEIIEKELTKLPSLFGKYTNGLYQYVKAEIIDNGFTLKLHYELDESKLSKSYVIDFGSPVVIPATDFMKNPDQIDHIVIRRSLKFGRVDVSDNQQTITYTPTLPVNSTDTVIVDVIYADNNKETFTIGIVPATNVYYEETFMNREGTVGDWVHTDSVTTEQEKELGGQKKYVYGYDQNLAAESRVAPSGGSKYWAELILADGKKTVYTNDKLTFSFTGTGFDLISDSGKNTGILVVRLDAKNAKTTKTYIIDTYFHGDENVLNNTNTIYQTPVIRELNLGYDTYTVAIRGALYRSSGAVLQPGVQTASTYSMQASVFADDEAFDLRTFLDECGLTDVSVDDVELIYMDENSVLNGGTGMSAETQTPVDINAVSTYAMNTTAANEGEFTATVSVDGFRVYNPLEKGSSVYISDKESGIEYKDLRQYVQENGTVSANINQVLYVEYNSELKVAEIAHYNTANVGTNGPKHEIYLAPGCGIAFALNSEDTIDVLQLSAKVVSGAPSLKVGDKTFAVTATDGTRLNGTEMYFDISSDLCIKQSNGIKYVTIINTASTNYTAGNASVLAVNVLKMGSGIATIAIDDETKNYILADFAASMASEPVDTFNPEVFEVSAPATVRRNRTFSISVNVSAAELEKVTVTTADGVETELNALNKLSVKWGISSEYYYLKTFRMKNSGEYTFKITAYGKDGSSVSKNVTVAVK